MMKKTFFLISITCIAFVQSSYTDLVSLLNLSFILSSLSLQQTKDLPDITTKASTLPDVATKAPTLADVVILNFEYKKYNTRIIGTFNEFKAWMLKNSLSEGKKALVLNTILKSYYPAVDPKITGIEWAKINLSDDNFEFLLSQSIDYTNLILLPTVNGFYSYQPNGEYWVDFANAVHFGGGFRGTKGNVQEERMFMEFPELAQLAYVMRLNPIRPISSTCVNSAKLTPDCAEPFLIYNVKRKFDVSATTYGGEINKDTRAKVQSGIKKINEPRPVGNIIGLAAIDWAKRDPKKYTLNDLKYLLKAAFLGFAGATIHNRTINISKLSTNIHTGGWGTGAFKNSISMMYVIQFLAAAIATNSSTVSFAKIPNRISLYYHTNNPAEIAILEETKKTINAYIQNKLTANQILGQLIILQEKQPKIWAPR